MGDQTPPAAPPPAGGEAAAEAPKNNMMLIIAGGCVVLFLGVIFIAIVAYLLFGGSGPSTKADLSSAESAAKTRMLFELQKNAAREAFQNEKGLKRIAAEEDGLQWLSDKTEAEKQIKKMKSRMEYWRDHRKDLENFTVEVVEAKEQGGPSTKEVTVKVVGKKMTADGDNWKLEDLNDKKTYVVTNLENKWWISEGR